MVVQMRNQQLYLVITDCLPPNASKNKDIVFLSRGGYMQGTSYTFNMLINTDNELIVKMDAILDMDTCGEECKELIYRTVGICDEAYPTIMKALWA